MLSRKERGSRSAPPPFPRSAPRGHRAVSDGEDALALEPPPGSCDSHVVFDHFAGADAAKVSISRASTPRSRS